MTLNPERFSRMALFILPVLTAWVFVPQLANAFAIKHHVAILGLLAMLTAALAVQERLALPKGWVGGAFLVWLVAVLGSALGAENFPLAAERLMEIGALALTAVFLFSAPNADAVQRHLEAGLMAAAAGVALFALKQYFLPDLLDPGFNALGKMRIYSTLGNPTLAAVIMLAALPSAAARVLRGGVASRAAHAALFALLLGGVAATQTRMALVAVAVMGVLALLWLGSARVRRVTLLTLVLALALAIGALLSIELPPELVHSIKGRWFIWLTALDMMGDHPFNGVGLGNFGLHHMDYQGRMFASGNFDAYFDNAAVITEGHNEFLNWGAEAGIVGFIAFVALCAGVLWHGWKSASLRQQAPQLYLALAGYMFAMLSVSLLAYPGTVLFFWLLLGMVMARIGLPRIEWLQPAWGRVAAVALMAGLLLGEGNWAWREAASGWREAQGDELMAQHDAWLAAKEYEEAISWYPWNGELHKKYATALFLNRQLNEALLELEQARQLTGDLGVLLLEGEVLARRGEADRAVAAYRSITAAFPNLVGAHFILGQIYLLQNKQELAEAEFRRVLAINPSPFNLSLTSEKVELQKRIVRDYLREPLATPAAPPGQPR